MILLIRIKINIPFLDIKSPDSWSNIFVFKGPAPSKFIVINLALASVYERTVATNDTFGDSEFAN